MSSRQKGMKMASRLRERLGTVGLLAAIGVVCAVAAGGALAASTSFSGGGESAGKDGSGATASAGGGGEKVLVKASPGGSAFGLLGPTQRGQYPALRAEVRTRPGDANIASTSVALPHSAFLAQEHIRTICTRVQFDANQCPAGSIYGHATATSPLLDYPLQANVYLRSSNNPLPDLVVALRGPAYQPIALNLVGRIDSKNGGIRTTFDTVPDAPVTKFVLEMQGGKKGLIVNSRNLCKSVNKATVKMTAQNGLRAESKPVLGVSCKKKKASGKGKKRAAGSPS
jgi:hypothetical protein